MSWLYEWLFSPKRNMESVGRMTRDAPPTDFVLRIETFSTLSSSPLESYESPEFEAAGEKWNIVIYPNGNYARGGHNHISLYLVLADESCLTLKKEISATFRLFVFDHIRNKYLVYEQASRFNEATYEYGFDQFLPLSVFNDASNGYLINDTCLFGAEVSLIQHTNKLKCLAMDPIKSIPFSYSWKINEFSKMEDKEYFSEKFTAWGYDWKLQLYPKGDKTGKGNYISLFLKLVGSGTRVLEADEQVIVQYELRLLDQINKRHFEVGTADYLSSSCSECGWGRFLSVTYMKDKSYGYLVDDSVILEADVTVLGSSELFMRAKYAEAMRVLSKTTQ